MTYNTNLVVQWENTFWKSLLNPSKHYSNHEILIFTSAATLLLKVSLLSGSNLKIRRKGAELDGKSSIAKLFLLWFICF